MHLIQVRGASIHNLKCVDIDIPKAKFIVFTGVSGSGKSSLAFDTLFEEGRRRYLHSIGLQTEVGAGGGEDSFRSIRGLPPAIAVEQRTIRQSNPNSIVGTKTKLIDLLKWLYTLEGRHADGVRTTLSIEAFSFKHPEGMCRNCFGRGFITFYDEDRIIPDRKKTLEKFCLESRDFGRTMYKLMPAWSKVSGLDWKSVQIDQLNDSQYAVFMNGRDGTFIGLLPLMKSLLTTPKRKVLFERRYASSKRCEKCNGFRVSEKTRCIRLGDKHIGELYAMSFGELCTFLQQCEQSDFSNEGNYLISQLIGKLQLLEDVGLSYLTMLRTIPSLSGGELQRLFLMNHLQSEFDSLLYIFDEPTAGLHAAEKSTLIHKLRSLTEAGNTVIVVEHDSHVIKSADYLVEFGPGAGHQGGSILFQGSISRLFESNCSVLAPFLFGKRSLPNKSERQYRDVIHVPKLMIRNAKLHNLQNITVSIPLGVMVGITGKSGSGKSTLVTNTLVPLLEQRLSEHNREKDEEESEEEDNHSPLSLIGKLENWESILKCVVISQAPIGRNRMSTPITYIGMWDKIRDIFAKQPAAEERSYTSGHFSFNTEHGACPHCKGDGSEELDMGAIGTFNRPCPECGGKRFRNEILEVTFQGYNIHDILTMGAEEALPLFKEHKTLQQMLKTLVRVGLGYISLGQPAPTLSGGEAQRLKLAKELGKPLKQGTLFILDEPTNGLSFSDIETLMLLLDELTEQGNTVIITEHETSMLSYCDWLIEIGPGGGSEGGRIIAEGTPIDLMQNKNSIIGPYLVE